MDVDKLIVAVLQREDADVITQALNRAGLAATVIASVGGFLRSSNVTLLVGLRARDLEKAVELFKINSHRRSVREPAATDVGSTLFIFPLERYVHLRNLEPMVDTRRETGATGSMRTIIAIVGQAQSDRLVKTLTDWSYRATLMSTSGAFLRRRNATLLIATRSERVDSIVDQIRQACEQDPDVDCGATVFVLECSQYLHM